MKDLNKCNYGIVGLGIMGGSIAKAIRENILCMNGSEGHIYAADINESSLRLSVEQKIIDKAFDISDVDKMLSDCDVVYICLYPELTVEFLIEHKKAFKKDSVVTDISGVKHNIFKSYKDFYTGDFDFIFGHPMAGSEKEGYFSSSGSVFKNRNYILIPVEQNKAENLELIKLLILSLGFTNIVETTAQIHDHKIAFTSQLCHVIASALVDCAEDTKVTSFGGGSFEDLTRIALINAPLWTELFLSNKDELLSHIEKFKSSLNELESFIQKDDSENLCSYLSNVRNKRQQMKN